MADAAAKVAIDVPPDDPTEVIVNLRAEATRGTDEAVPVAATLRQGLATLGARAAPGATPTRRQICAKGPVVAAAVPRAVARITETATD